MKNKNTNIWKAAYGIGFLGIAAYLFSVDSLTIRRVTIDGLELLILGASFIVGFVNIFLGLALGYSNENKEHSYHFYNYALAAVSITLMLIAVLFQALETEVFGLQGL